MTTVKGSEEHTMLSHDEAFALMGDKTRLKIIQILGEADRPLAFSDIFDNIEYDGTSNFGYHLDKLVGLFVRKTGSGYELTQSGRRVVEAIRSGIITDDTVIERTEIDTPCYLCGEPIEVRYQDERVELYCSACEGLRSGASRTTEWATDTASDIIGFLDLPPAGVRARTPSEIHQTAEVWTLTEAHALARGVCPRCSALVDHSVEVCDDHDAEDGQCDQCGQRFSATIHVSCTNCILRQSSIFSKHLLTNPDVMTFLIDHGIDPITPEGIHLSAIHEEILSTDPFKACFTFTIDDDSLTVTVDDDLSVVVVNDDNSTSTDHYTF